MQARHVSEVYKRTLLAADCARRGDVAVITRDHHNHETGLTVSVVNDPHWCDINCAECHQLVRGYAVEVACAAWPAAGGPYFFPVNWLRRVLPI